MNLRQNIAWMERETFGLVLKASTQKQDAARLMGISPRALSYYLGKYPLADKDRASL